MTRPAYYNEFEPYCAAWLRNLIAAGHLPAGDVDERDIRDVRAADLAGYGSCHWFAGIGGFPLGLRLGGVPDDFPIWTGGWPCQPFSAAGQRRGKADDRDLWPELFRLVAQGRPAWLLGENVAGFVGMELDRTLADLEGEGFAARPFAVPACAVDAPHIRERCFVVAHAEGHDDRLPVAGAVGGQEPQSRGDRQPGALADADGGGPDAGRGDDGEMRGLPEAQRQPEHGPALSRRGGARHGALAGAPGEQARPAGQPRQRGDVGDAEGERLSTGPCKQGDRPAAPEFQRSGFWSRAEWLLGADGKRRRAQPGIRLLAHGVPARVAKLRALGNAVVPQVVAEIGRAILAEAA